MPPFPRTFLPAGMFAFALLGRAVAAATPLQSDFFEWASLTPKTTKAGQSRFIADATTPTLTRFECHATTLLPGHDSHPPHHHPQEEIIVLRHGAVQVSINGQKTRAKDGALFFFAAHDVHNMTNVGDDPATYYVINFYTKATGEVRNQPAVQYEPANYLHSSVIAWDSVPPQTTATGERRSFVDAPTLTFAHLDIHATTLSPGTPAAKVHRHPWVEFVVVKDGAVRALVGSETRTVSAGSSFFVPANADQSYGNAGSTPATYYVIAVRSAEVRAS